MAAGGGAGAFGEGCGGDLPKSRKASVSALPDSLVFPIGTFVCIAGELVIPRPNKAAAQMAERLPRVVAFTTGSALHPMIHSDPHAIPCSH